jgi:tetratricopeptide (TPR) repeat protein
MKHKYIKAILMVAFIVLTAGLSYLGFNKKEASIDFAALEKEKSASSNSQNEEAFENILKNIGNSTSLVKPDILQSNDTARLSLSIRLLDTMKQYTYAGVLAERLGNIQNTSERYHSAARYYLLATEEHKNELMLFKKARKNLETAIALTPQNLDAKVDLAVSIYNINNFQKPDDRMDLMKPAKLLLEVVRTDSTHIDAQYYLAKLAVESNQLEKAIERFKKLVYLQPQNQEYCLELSKIYGTLGNQKESEAWALKAQALN